MAPLPAPRRRVSWPVPRVDRVSSPGTEGSRSCRSHTALPGRISPRTAAGSDGTARVRACAGPSPLNAPVHDTRCAQVQNGDVKNKRGWEVGIKLSAEKNSSSAAISTLPTCESAKPLAIASSPASGEVRACRNARRNLIHVRMVRCAMLPYAEVAANEKGGPRSRLFAVVR